ncbi:MAG: carbohydrate-binding family 9-like protein [Oscillospiraceae bacterium]|nr:carbohydrate-binding family 9-like protein [Oscillospiraceae bacterium]
MRNYTIVKKPENMDWSKVPVAPIDNYLWLGETDITCTAQVCYDADAMYVRMTAKEQNIRAEETELLGMPCLDSCLEFFFRPYEDSMRYINIELNPNCCMWLGYRDEENKLIRIEEPSSILDAKAERTADGWVVVYRVPTALVQKYFPDYKPESGKKLPANFYKCGDLSVKKHYIAWNRIDREEPAFHVPEWFGMTEFE